MNRARWRPAHPDAPKEKKNGSDYPWPTFTHCVVCDYESSVDFDICPRCGAKRMAVIVLKRA